MILSRIVGVTISQTDEKLDIPVDEFDGKVIYGERRKQEGSKRFDCRSIDRDYPFSLVSAAKGHVDTLAPTVSELVELEKRVQSSFFALKKIRQFSSTA